MRKLLLVLLCLFFGAFSWGCRSGVYGDYGSTLINGSSAVSGTVTATLAGGSIRAVAGSVGVAGAYVWIEERPDLNATTDANGNYVINNVPAGTFNVVARFTQGNTQYKTRQKSVIVEENKSKEVSLNVVEAKNVVKGQLLDENGVPLPLGTKLYLWGEEFEIIDGNGNFISPPLPDLALEDLLQEIIVNQGQANQFNMPVSFVSDDEPLEIKVYVPSNPSAVSLLPKVALVAIVNGALVKEVDAGAQVTVRAIVHPADITSENILWVAPALGTLGEATVVNNNLREKIWTAPAAAGRAEIKVEITSANKTAFAMLPIKVKGPQAPVQFVITFNSNGGSAEAAQTINSGAKAVEPSSAPTKAGFTFAGWYKEEALTNAWNFATDSVTSAKTLFAKWTANPTYTVTYNGNGNTGGTVPTDASIYAQGAQITVADNTGNLIKSDHTFAGWNTAEDGSGTSYAAAANFNMGNADVTLYAKWNPVFTVTFNSNGGDTQADPASKIVGPGVALGALPTPPTKARMYFRGWNSMANGSGTAYDNASVISSNTTLYAIFSYFEAGSGTVGDPYHVKTPFQLYITGTSNYYDKHYIQMEDINLDHDTLAIPANSDWYSAEKGWSSYRGGGVRGVYDGNNKTISNLYMKDATATYNGLFYVISDNATVKNVRLTDINIEGNRYVGGLTGMHYGRIENCSAIGIVKATSEGGGLLGGTYSNAVVERCYANCTITIKAGGFINGGFIGSNSGAISNCYAQGSINSDSNQTGGFAGHGNSGSITNCYSTTVISNKGSGFALFHAETPGCYWDTDVSGAGSSERGTAKSTAQMKTAATFIGWDPSIWNIQDGEYPTLK